MRMMQPPLRIIEGMQLFLATTIFRFVLPVSAIVILFAGPTLAQSPNAGFDQWRAEKPLTAAEERALTPKATFRECDVCPEMVVVPAGHFTMGSPEAEKPSPKAKQSEEPGEESGAAEAPLFGDFKSNERPQHVVMIAKAFAVGRVEITIEQFAAFVRETRYAVGTKCFLFDPKDITWKEKAGRSWRNPGYPQTRSHPAACLNWHDAKAYVARLSRKAGRDYRLLTEAEWEYAARAGTTTDFHFGNDEGAICAYGNSMDRTAQEIWFKAGTTRGKPPVPPCRDGFASTAAAGSFSANAFGLYDMNGNVWETVEDCEHKNYDGAPADGSAWLSGDCSHRMRRGGSFFHGAPILTSANRFAGVRDDRVDDVGFRVARTLKP